tara:strand:+ start:1250 stop:2794 length:1545 start_codon:yes stop_codon:yes gene_type:complete
MDNFNIRREFAKRIVPPRLALGDLLDIRSGAQPIPQDATTPLAPGNWIPRKDITFNLGLSGRAWDNIHVKTINFDGGGSMTSATSVSGATTVAVTANNSTDETTYPVFVDGATGAQGIESDTGFTYNPSTGILTATRFAGAVTGDVTGNVTGSAATTTGAAAVATTVTITDNESEAEENAIIFTANGAKTGGNLALESDGDLHYTPSTGKLQATYTSADSYRLKAETSTGIADTFGIFQYKYDGGGADVDTLGFLCNQDTATVSQNTAESAFWIMQSESDGATGSRLILEPSVDWGATDTTKNRTMFGWHNPVFASYIYYTNAGYGTAASPGFSFMGDYDTGMYRLSSNIIGFTAGGLSVAGMYASDDGGGSFSGGIYPTTDDRYDLGTGSYRWDDIFATSGTVNTSDSRLKENIQPAKLGLDFINDLNPITYKWKKKNKKKVDATHHGVIAQEVVETLKDHGIDSLEDFGGIYHDGEDESHYGARYTEFIPILMKAVQELSAEVKELKEKVYA